MLFHMIIHYTPPVTPRPSCYVEIDAGSEAMAIVKAEAFITSLPSAERPKMASLFDNLGQMIYGYVDRADRPIFVR
jgi:hypothetical protein